MFYFLTPFYLLALNHSSHYLILETKYVWNKTIMCKFHTTSVLIFNVAHYIIFYLLQCLIYPDKTQDLFIWSIFFITFAIVYVNCSFFLGSGSNGPWLIFCYYCILNYKTSLKVDSTKWCISITQLPETKPRQQQFMLKTTLFILVT